MSDTSGERSYGRRAWLIFFVLGFLFLTAAPINLLGHPPDPPSPERFTGLSSDEIAARVPGITGYISSISRQMGNFMLCMSVLLMGVAAFPFRRGEKWAWFVMWSAPLMLLIQFLNSDLGFGWQFDFGGIFVALAGLLLPYRRFFPKK